MDSTYDNESIPSKEDSGLSAKEDSSLSAKADPGLSSANTSQLAQLQESSADQESLELVNSLADDLYLTDEMYQRDRSTTWSAYSNPSVKEGRNRKASVPVIRPDQLEVVGVISLPLCEHL